MHFESPSIYVIVLPSSANLFKLFLHKLIELRKEKIAPKASEAVRNSIESEQMTMKDTANMKDCAYIEYVTSKRLDLILFGKNQILANNIFAILVFL